MVDACVMRVGGSAACEGALGVRRLVTLSALPAPDEHALGVAGDLAIWRSASAELVLIEVASCSMRALSASAAALVRSSICSVTVSARPTSSCSKRPMRVSRVFATSMVLATSMARVPSALVDVVDLGADRRRRALRRAS